MAQQQDLLNILVDVRTEPAAREQLEAMPGLRIIDMFSDDESEELAWADENHILTYVPELQADWEATKNQLMFELQKAKFCPTGQATAKASAVRMVAAGVLHVTEHAEDAVWGDKKNGKGNNRLGKLIATVLQHKNGNGEQEFAWSAALQASLEEPAVDTVHYPTTAP